MQLIFIIKIGLYWKKQHIDQWNRAENTKMDPHLYGQLLLKEQEKKYLVKETLINKWFRKKLDIHLHKDESGPFSYTKHNLKMDEIPKSETVIHPNPRGKFR